MSIQRWWAAGGVIVGLYGCSFDASSIGGPPTLTPTSTTDGGVDATGSSGTSGSSGGLTTGILDGSGTSGGSGGSTGEPPPAPLLARVGTFAAPMSAGVEAVDGVGFEPRAVLLWVTDHTAVGPLDGLRVSRGWTDGVHDGAVATAWSAGSNNARGRWVDDACVTLVNEQDAVLAEASIAGVHDDGFSLDWSVPGQGRQVVYLALGGPIRARVGNLVLAGNGEGVDGVGFSPDVVLAAGVQMLVAPGTNNRGGHGFGVAIAGGSSHGSAHREGSDGQGSSGLTDDVALVLADDQPAPEQSYALSGVVPDGFAFQRVLGMAAIGTTWLALEGVRAEAGVLTQPGSAGAQPTAVGFEPVVVMFDGGDTDAWAGEPEGIHGVAVPGQSQAALWFGRSGVTSRSSWELERAVVSRDPASLGVEAEASVAGIGADGFTLDWSSSDGVARRIGWLALGSR